MDHNILTTLNAMHNCLDQEPINIEWYDKHMDRITETLLDILPHGSGIDCKWEFDYTNKGVFASNSWHRMNGNGMYCGYIDFTIKIKADFRDMFGKVIFSIVGRFGKHQDIKEYLYEIIGYALRNC